MCGTGRTSRTPNRSIPRPSRSSPSETVPMTRPGPTEVADGRVVKGRKIGLTSKVMQRAVSIDEPDYGVLFDDMFVEDGGHVPAGRFIRPRVEVELAFVLGEALCGPDV